MPKEYQNSVLNIGVYVDPYTGEAYNVHGEKMGIKYDSYPISINVASLQKYAEMGHKVLQDGGIRSLLGLQGGKTWVLVLFASDSNDQKGIMTVGEYAADYVKNGAEIANKTLLDGAWAQFKERE